MYRSKNPLDTQILLVVILYFQGYYNTMDSGYYDGYGNIAVMARTDDVINVAGHR